MPNDREAERTDAKQPVLPQGALRRQVEFETFLVDLSTTFIALPDEQVDASMVEGLARVGAFLQMDRVTLLELTPDRDAMAVAYSWSSPGVGAPPPFITKQAQPWWVGQVLRGAVSLAPRLDDLPGEAAIETEYLRQRGVVSAASIPLRVGGEIAGAVSFVTVHRHESWAAETVNRLKAIADILWNALKRRRALQALLAAQNLVRESEERFRLIASTAPAIIWMSDDNKQCTYINECWTRVTGQPQDAALGRGWAALIHPEDMARWDIVTNAIDRREPFNMEYRLRRHDGEIRWFFAQGVPRYDAQRTFLGYIGSAVDVSERKEAEELLSTLSQRLIEAQEQERSRLARELHDDITQRLALLALNLTAMRERVQASAPELRDEVGMAIDAASTLASDVQSLSHRLHSSKILTLGIQLAIRELCREFSERSGLEIDFRSDGIDAGLPEDRSVCLYRVLQEALQNAIKHSGSRHIAVSLHSDSTGVTLIVRDSGDGFEPNRAFKSGGLGLVSMKERLKSVHGQLMIETQTPGGTTIRARVPIVP